MLWLDPKLEAKLVDLVMLGARHWLPIFTLLVLLFIVPIVGSPLLMSTGNPVLQSIGNIIFLMYKVTCHQLPERSLFVFGYQMTVCARCFGIYMAFLAGCVVFAFVRKWLKIWSLKYYVLLCVPMAIDGFAQLFGVPIPRGIGPHWELIWTTLSNNELRLVTGSIFGLASALYVLPYLEEIFSGEMNPNGTKIQKPAASESSSK